MRSSVLIPSPLKDSAYINDPTIENEGKLASARQKGAIVSALLIPGDADTATIFEIFFCELVVASSPTDDWNRFGTCRKGIQNSLKVSYEQDGT
jgi:hypothetical protein